MPAKHRKRLQPEHLRDLAVRAVMEHGSFEPSGHIKLAVYKTNELMIAYRTPFNGVPRPSDPEKYDMARAGIKRMTLLPYAIDVWSGKVGRVLSVAWRPGGEIQTSCIKPGGWIEQLEARAAQERRPRPERDRQAGSTARSVVRLERENERLRKVISELVATMPTVPQATA